MYNGLLFPVWNNMIYVYSTYVLNQDSGVYANARARNIPLSLHGGFE
jgi:hypothetical protein